MNARNKSSPPTTPSTFPVIKRYGSPYALVNPGSRAENVIEIVERVVHAPLPAGYREIDDVVRKSESNPHRAAVLARARQRLANQVEDAAKKPTLASLRLKAGLSQAKVAELLGNSQSSYSLIESGRRADILHSTFEKLIPILHVSRDELATALKESQEKTP
jgi:DNA-binding XRE family transcriptional regulator